MTTYNLNRRGFRKNLLNAEWMVEEMDRRADRGYEFARANAPDAPPLEEGYIASFVIFNGRDGGIHHDRAYAELANISPHALEVEFGNGHSDGQHVLTRALDVMGQ